LALKVPLRNYGQAQQELKAAADSKKQLQLPSRARQSNAFNLEEDVFILKWICNQQQV